MSMKYTSALLAAVSTGVSRLYCHVSPTLGTQPSSLTADVGCAVSGLDGLDVDSSTGAGSGDIVVVIVVVSAGIVDAGTGDGTGVGSMTGAGSRDGVVGMVGAGMGDSVAGAGAEPPAMI